MGKVEAEQLRQEREAFAFNMGQARAWSRLRLSMGWAALVIYIFVAILCATVMILHRYFPPNTGKWALVVLGGDILVMAHTVMKLVFAGSPSQMVAPMTRAPSVSQTTLSPPSS